MVAVPPERRARQLWWWSSIGAPANVWSHVVLTFDAGTVTVFVNGRLDRTWTVPFTTLQTPPPSWNYLRIGGPSFGGNYPYVGALDELAFFDRALNPTEVEATYLAGTSSMCAPVATVLEVPAVTTTYGAGTYPGLAIFARREGPAARGQDGDPHPGGRQVRRQRPDHDESHRRQRHGPVGCALRRGCGHPCRKLQGPLRG